MGLRYEPFDPRPEVTVEIFIDLNCPDSMNAWPIMKQVQAYYGHDKLDLIVQQMPLPYHRNAFLNTQGRYLIENSTDAEVRSHLFDYIESALSMWSNFSTANTVNMTETEVLDMLANMAVTVTGVSKVTFIAEIGNYRQSTINAWKFAARRGVSNTPAFFCNGVELGNGLQIPNFNDWIAFLNKIIN
jgi:predicted DsbA family dithiol-disulfide isomerase